MPGISESGKFNIFGHGEAYNRGVLGDATLEFRGSGLVGTAYGFPGLTATLVGTGIVDIRLPLAAERGYRIYPHAMGPEPKGPTGAFLGPAGSGGVGAVPNFNVNMSHVSGQSGSSLLNITSPFQGASSAAGGFASGFRPVNAPTGAVVNLLILGSPVRRY